MIPVLTVGQMRKIDEETFGGNLTLSYSYMLKAGLGILTGAQEMLGNDLTGEIAVICGKGNNGGDGFVAARMLLEAGYRVMCYSLHDTEELRGECRIAFDEYVSRKGNFQVLDDIEDLSSLSKFTLIIDAMLGIGLRGDPHGLCAQAIEAVNNSGVPVLAVDTPSGLNNDTGIPSNPCIRATATVTMGFPKLGLYFYPGKSMVGKLVIQDLGYPDDIVARNSGAIYYPSQEYLKKLLPCRHPDGSKFDHGVTLLVCGSKNYTGSAALVANATMRAGCGMTHLAVPESAASILSVKLTEPIIHPLNETASGTLSSESGGLIVKLSQKMNVLCVGPGLTHEPQVTKAVQDIIKTISLPVVLDADGINAFRDNPNELRAHTGPLICTPHKGEWRRVFGELPEEPSALISRLQTVVQQYNIILLLKGSPTIVAEPSGTVFILPFGNSSLAKAGSGDVLSGIITSLIAQGASLTDAAILGCYIHGETAELLSREQSEYSVTATDIIEKMYRVIQSLINSKI